MATVDVKPLRDQRRDSQNGFTYHFHRVYTIPIGATLAAADLEEGDLLPADMDDPNRPAAEIMSSGFSEEVIKGIGVGQRAVVVEAQASMCDTVAGLA